MNRLSLLLFAILPSLMALDAMITTPIALAFVPNTIEANPFGAVGYARFGLDYFFIAGAMQIVLLALIVEGLDQLGIWMNRERVLRLVRDGNLNAARYHPLTRHAPVLVGTLPGIAILGYTVWNNASIILGWIF